MPQYFGNFIKSNHRSFSVSFKILQRTPRLQFSRLISVSTPFYDSISHRTSLIAIEQSKSILSVPSATIRACSASAAGPSAASKSALTARIARYSRRGENIISGSRPFLIFRLHYDVLQTSWVANSIARALNTTLLRLAGYRGRSETPIYLNFCPDSIWEIVQPAALRN